MKGYGQGWRAGFRQSKALTERQTRERSTNFTSPNMSCEVTASLGYLPFAPRRARRLDWVETTHQPVAAFGKRTFNVGFPAVSSKSCRSPPDPEETFAVCRCNACFQEKRTLLSLRVTGESGH